MIIESVTDLIEPVLHPRYTTYRIGERTIGLVLNEDVSLDAAGNILRHKLLQKDNLAWQLGDLINQSTLRFGEIAAQIIPDDSDVQFNNAYQRLAKWSSIASRYDLTERLYPLSFSHYQECAYIQNKAARAELLQWALVPNADGSSKTTKDLRDERNRRYPDAHKGLQWVDNAPILNDNSHTMVLDAETVNQVRLGNLRSLSSLFKQWRGVMQAGKRYEIVLREVRD